MNIFEEMYCRWAFDGAKMMGIEVTEPNWNDLPTAMALGQFIEQFDVTAIAETAAAKVESGQAPKQGNYLTPLMLYIMMHITDERLETEIAKGRDEVLKSTPLTGFRQSTPEKINALWCAVQTNQPEVLSRLLATGFFNEDPRNYSEAIDMAVL